MLRRTAAAERDRVPRPVWPGRPRPAALNLNFLHLFKLWLKKILKQLKSEVFYLIHCQYFKFPEGPAAEA